MPFERTRPAMRTIIAGACVLLLVVSIVPLIGATYAYGEEAPASAQQEEQELITQQSDQSTEEATVTHEVFVDYSQIGQTESYSISVVDGDTIPVPHEPPATTEKEDGPATFRGWVVVQGKGASGYGMFITPDDVGVSPLYDFSAPVTGDLRLIPQYVTATTDVFVTLTLNIPGYHPNTPMANQFAGWVKKGSTIADNPELAAFFTKPYAHDGTDASELTVGKTLSGWYTVGGKMKIDLDTPIYRDESEHIGTSYLEIYTVWEEAVAPTPVIVPVSGTSGVTAMGVLSGANIPKDATVTVSADAVTSGAAFDELDASLGNGVLAGIFEVNMIVNGQQVHDRFGSLTVTFPVDTKYNGHWVTVWHRHNDGSITSERAIAENGAVAVTVTDLSTFALEIGELAEGAATPVSLDTTSSSDSSTLAKTGDTAPVLAFGGFALAALGAVAFAGYRTRKSARK